MGHSFFFGEGWTILRVENYFFEYRLKCRKWGFSRLSAAYRPNSIFAVWDGMFWVCFSVFREFDTVPNAFFLIGTVWRRAYEGCFRLFYTVPKTIF